ncbi:MAG: ribbon-helix-helix protein, CopG family [Candidatus Omnitrophica bacterium]|nr:ribbon-helix-helix protein, CopG family [Candidatus Omnitrophota bacterium]
MRNIVTISLPDHMLNHLMKTAGEEKASRSEIIKRSLNRYFFAYDFAKARDKALSELAKRGDALTEEEVFKVVS